MNKKLTLGQGIDAMLDGKVVKIGPRYTKWAKDKRSFQYIHDMKDNDWEWTKIDWADVADARQCCYIHEPPVKWVQVKPEKAMRAAYQGKPVKEMSIGHERMVDWGEMKGWRVDDLLHCDELFIQEQVRDDS
jgi:hypothetical protein